MAVALSARYAILAASTALTLALTASPTGAQQIFTVDDPQTVTNGGNPVLTDFGTLIVTEGGSIDVSTIAGDNAVEGTGDNISIEVRGALSAQGDDSSAGGNGIFVDGDAAVIVLTETGTITTGGEDAYGQYIVGNDGTITNAGTITTGGEDALGQYIFGDYGTITNSGAITTVGGAFGQVIEGNFGTITNAGTITIGGNEPYGGQFIHGEDGTIANTGMIVTGGQDAYGQYHWGAGGTITNAGTITTGGVNAHGQYIIGDAGTITNTGVIETGGVGAFGQFLDGSDGTVTNSGWLVSRQAAAIRIDDAEDNNTINLLAPGFIGGAIDFSDDPGNGGGPPTNTTVNIVTGLSHSIFWTLEGDMVGGAPNISGSVPWFYNAATQSVATFDPTLLSSETAALGDLTMLLSRVGLGAVQGFGAGLGSGGINPLAYQPGESYPAGVQATERAMQGDVGHRFGRVWATVLGGQMDHDGGTTTFDSTIGHFGFAGGTTWQHTPSTTLSAMAGYIAGSNEADATWSPSFDHDTHTLFASLHGEHQLDWAALQFGVTAGYSHVDHNRFVNDNLAPLGESWVSADYGGFFLSPELALSTDIVLESGQILTPNAGLRYAAQWLGGYSETGAISPAANATVEDRFVGTLEARVGLDVTRSLAFGDRTGTLTGRIGYLGRWSTGDDSASITLNGVTQTVASDAQDLNAVTVGATLRSDLGETAFLELDANYLLGDTAQGFDGRITLGIAF